MARAFAEAFYQSRAWKDARAAYARSVHNLCERCLAEGRYSPLEIVHHRIHLSPENISDPSITLSFDNLEGLCRECHAAEHPEIYGTSATPGRVAFDENGNVIRKESAGLHEDEHDR